MTVKYGEALITLNPTHMIVTRLIHNKPYTIEKEVKPVDSYEKTMRILRNLVLLNEETFIEFSD